MVLTSNVEISGDIAEGDTVLIESSTTKQSGDLWESKVNGREEVKYEIIRNIASGVAEPVTE